MTVPENVDGQNGTRMQDAVRRIQELGVPPEGFEDAGFPGEEGGPSDEILDLWESYQDAVVSITRPVTWEEAEILIRCCPTDHMAGIEWTVLHGIGFRPCIPPPGTVFLLHENLRGGAGKKSCKLGNSLVS